MSEKKIKWLLFWFLFSYYALFFGGTYYASDEIIIARQSQSLVESQRLNFPPTFGRSDSPYGILNTLLGIPPYLIFKAITNFTGSSDLFPPWNIFALSNLLISPLIMVVMFTILRYFNVPLNLSLCISMLTGLTTEFLTYAKTFFTEPLFSLFLLLSVFFIYRSWQAAEGLKFSLYAGICFAAALHSRFIAIFYVPAIIIFILGIGNESITQRAKKLLLFILPVSVAILLWMWLNYLMRGGIFRSGYETSTFSGHLFSGLFGLLFSPGRGFFMYNPWAIVAVAIFPLFFKRQPRLAVFTLVLFLITLLSYARFWTWHGGWTPGCRFLLPLAPLVFLWLTPLFIETATQFTYIVFWRGIAIILLALSVVFQVAKSLVNVLDYNNELFGLVGGESPLLFIPQTSALTGIKHLILDGNLDIILFKYGGKYPALIIPLYLIMLSILVYCGQKIWSITIPRGVNWLRLFINNINKFRVSLSVCLILLILYIISGILGGPRGLVLQIDDSSESRLDKRLRLNKSASPNLPEKFMWSGFIEAPTEKDFIFYLKVLGTYEVNINNQQIFFNDKQIPQHLPRSKVELHRGIYPISINYKRYQQDKAVFYLYWTVPGEARYIEPVSGEYLHPAFPTKSHLFFTNVKRHLWLLIVILLLPVFSVEYLSFCRRSKLNAEG